MPKIDTYVPFIQFSHCFMTPYVRRNQLFCIILNFAQEMDTFIVFSVLKNMGLPGFWGEIRQSKILLFLSL